MKIKFLMVGALLLTGSIAFAQFPGKGDAKQFGKKNLVDAKIEVIDVKVEKVEGLSSTTGGVKITGKAKYIPGKVTKKQFKELVHNATFDLLDDAGNKVAQVGGIPTCGENGSADNVVPKEEFPFVLVDEMVAKEKHGLITSVKLKEWVISQ